MNFIETLLLCVYTFSILGTMILTGIESYRDHGTLLKGDFVTATLPISWLIAPIWFTMLACDMSGLVAYTQNRSAIRAWDKYDRLALEARLIPEIAVVENFDEYGYECERRHAYVPTCKDPRVNPDPPALPSVHRVRQLLAQAGSKKFIDVPKEDAERVLNEYRHGVRNARIAELEQELKELHT